MSSRLLLFLFLITTIHLSQPLSAQNVDLNQRDLSKVRVDQISDAQLRKYVEAMESRNVTEQQVEAGALARGMSQSEVNKLMNRIRNLRSGGGQRSQAGSRQSGSNFDESGGRGQQTQRDTMLDQEVSEEEKKIFGFDLFNSEELTFAPGMNMATPQNYQVGPGDELIINIWGASRQEYNLEVNRDGTVVIDNLGPVYVSGLSIEEASRRIKNRLTEIYSGLRGYEGRPANTYAEVTLGRIRSINVSIVGEVRKPGTYTIPSLATAFNALYLSGGPNFVGSFRDIEIVRNGKVVMTLDVYDFLRKGEQAASGRLQDQDIIRVVPYETRVELKGQVKRPGYYELTEGESLADAIRYGGGFTDKAYTHRLKVVRKTPQAKRIEDVAGEALGGFDPRNGDIVQVDSVLDRYENRVEIYGAVFRPGEYALSEGMTLANIIDKAEGLKEDAFTRRALIYRKGKNFTTNVISVNLEELSKDASSEVPLMREDVIRVLSIFDLEEEYTVEVKGEVQNSGKFPYFYDMSLEDLIAMAGGMKESASRARIEVARRVRKSDVAAAGTDADFTNLETADIFQFTVDENLSIDSTDHFTLKPFDQVFIRKSPGYEKQRIIYVRGEVAYPGAYALKDKNESISDVVRRAGGLTSFAYAEGARLVRLNPAYFKERTKREKEIKDSLLVLQYRQRLMERDTGSNFENDSDLNRRQFVAGQERFMNRNYNHAQMPQDTVNNQILVPSYELVEPMTQSIGINLEKILDQPNSKFDLRLLPGDTVEVPKVLQTVKMSGALLYPVSSRFDKRKGFKRYIAEAGGFTKGADKKRSYIIYANGSVDRTRGFLFIKNYPKVKPGAEIVVPEKPERDKLGIQQLAVISSALATLSLVVIRMTDLLGR